MKATARMVRENLEELRKFLNREGLYPLTGSWYIQQSSTTYGRAWRLEYDCELPEALKRHIGSSGFLGDTNAEALERTLALIHIADAIRKTRVDSELRTLEKFAKLGVPSAVIALQFVRDGMTFDEAYAVVEALGVAA